MIQPPRLELVEARYVELPPTHDERGNLALLAHLKGERSTALTINLN